MTARPRESRYEHPPAEREEASSNRCSALGRLLDELDILAHGVRYVGPRQDEAGGAEHHRHLVVCLVSHPASQLANYLDPLGLPDPLLGTPAG